MNGLELQNILNEKIQRGNALWGAVVFFIYADLDIAVVFFIITHI